MTTDKLLCFIRKIKAIHWLPVVAIFILTLALYINSQVQKNRSLFPYSLACRGGFVSEAQYDDKTAKINSTVYFSFLNSNKILVSLSGNAFLYDAQNKLIEKRILLRNIYYDYVLENKTLQTYTLTSRQINTDSIDTMDETLSSLVLMNSFYITGHTDTLVLKKYDDNTMLIETSQSPLVMCVFKPIH